MSDEQTRFSYRFDRVLIEAARVLSPVLPGVVARLTGAHVEILRNLLHYAHKRSTYVSQYLDTCYDAPGDTDFSAILEVVAEMEYELMGTENTIFGIYERWVEHLGGTKTGDGLYTKATEPIPEGYIYMLNYVYVSNQTTAPTLINIKVAGGGISCYLKSVPLPGLALLVSSSVSIALAEGDYLTVEVFGCLDGDAIIGAVRGYKMKVQV